MSKVNGGSESFFSKETYQEFLLKQSFVQNARSRGKDETIFDVVLSEEADFTKCPEGEEILKAIRSYK